MSIDSLFTETQKELLQANFAKALELGIEQPNFKPVVCLRVPRAGYTFLVTQLVANDPGCVMCLADYGPQHDLRLTVLDLNNPEYDANRYGSLVLDPSFDGKYNLAVYAKVADLMGAIVTDENDPDVGDLFSEFREIERYNDPSKNLRRFQFEWIYKY